MSAAMYSLSFIAENAGNGLTWGASFDDSFPLAAILGLLILDAKLYLLLAWCASMPELAPLSVQYDIAPF